MPKPTILTFVAYYLPGYKSGGPVRSISNMVELLGDDFNFKIITTDRDVFETSPYPHITVNDWNPVRKASVFYASPGFLTIRKLKYLFDTTEHDLIYFNSFFSPYFSTKPLLALSLSSSRTKPILIAPRGEFSLGALQIHSFRKKWYLTVANLLNKTKRINWHATTDLEVQDIRSVIKRVNSNTFVAHNIPSLCNRNQANPTHIFPTTSTPDCLRIVFLSRVSPKKNLDFAIQVLRMVRCNVIFDIFGIVGNEPYWLKCKELIATLPSNVSVNYKGAISHDTVSSTLTNYDLFFLPTHGENFGHAIYEALAAGVPALISDQTPWQDLQQHNAGWSLPLAAFDSFSQTIEWLSNLSQETKQKQRIATKEYASNKTKWRQLKAQSKDLFFAALSQSHLEQNKEP